MVALVTKTIFYTTVQKVGDIWLSITTLPQIGDVQAEADSVELIDWHTRANICGYMELDPFDFDVHYEFSGEAPKYYLD